MSFLVLSFLMLSFLVIDFSSPPKGSNNCPKNAKPRSELEKHLSCVGFLEPFLKNLF